MNIGYILWSTTLTTLDMYWALILCKWAIWHLTNANAAHVAAKVETSCFTLTNNASKRVAVAS